MPLLPAKLITEMVLFMVSWAVQRRFVFARRVGRGRPITPGPGTGRVNITSASRTVPEEGSPFARR